MYMSVEDQYFWEFVLVISIGITFAFWYIKNYVKKYIDAKMKKQYQLGFYKGYDLGWSTAHDLTKYRQNSKKII